MSFDPEFLTLMTQTVTISKLVQSATDPHADQTFTATFSSPCHLSSPSVRRDTLAAGAIRTPTGRVYLPPNTEDTIDPGDRITLPNGTTREVLTVDQFWDEDGLHHQVVSYG